MYILSFFPCLSHIKKCLRHIFLTPIALHFSSIELYYTLQTMYYFIAYFTFWHKISKIQFHVKNILKHYFYDSIFYYVCQLFQIFRYTSFWDKPHKIEITGWYAVLKFLLRCQNAFQRSDWLTRSSPVDQTPAHTPSPLLSLDTPLSQNQVLSRKVGLRLNHFHFFSTFPCVPLWRED